MKSTRSCLLSFVLAFSLIIGCLACSSSSYGVEIIDGNLTEIEIPTEQGISAEAINYSSSPSSIRVFIYNESEDPFCGLTVNTENCLDGFLYAVNVNTGAVTLLSQQAVACFTTTKDHVYYVANGYIYQTDYSSGTTIVLYDMSDATISSLDYFDGILYFIEDWKTIITLDLETLRSEAVLEQPGMVWAFFYDSNKLVWRDTKGRPYYYILGSTASIPLESEYDLNCLIDPYIIENFDATVSMLSSTTSAFRNDINFPFPEYPAAADSNGSFNYSAATSYFNNTNSAAPSCNHPRGATNPQKDCKEYACSKQCDGFARYAHERFIHITGSTKSAPYRPSGDTNGTDRLINSVDWLKTFFSSLSRGAFVRYGKIEYEEDKDGNIVTDADGKPKIISQEEAHSIVFDYADDNGIWVYECNQDWKCGVFYHYYKYTKLAGNYQYIALVVNHTFTGTCTSQGSSSHKLYCANCSGYLVQSHNYSYSPLSTTKHTMTCTDCGYTASEAHLFVGTICKLCRYDTNGPVIWG